MESEGCESKWSYNAWPILKTSSSGKYSGKSSVLGTTECGNTYEMKADIKLYGSWHNLGTLSNVAKVTNRPTIKANFGQSQVDYFAKAKEAKCRAFMVAMTVKMDGQTAGPGIKVAFTSKKPSKKTLQTWTFKKALTAAITGSDGKILATYKSCDAADWAQGDTIYASFRSEYHGRSRQLKFNRDGWTTGALNFRGPAPHVFAAPKVSFSSPIMKGYKAAPTSAYSPKHGPFGVDHGIQSVKTKRLRNWSPIKAK